jgi:LacI family transcriptional regulator
LSEADDGAVVPARAVRMKDIAEHLGLSQTTVSHVLTGKHQKFRISPATVERVFQLAEKLGYRANVMARAFRERRSYAVCLAVEDLQNPFWAGVAIGAEREAEEHGYALVVTDLGGSAERQRRALQLVRDQRVDGLIVSPVRGGDADLVPAAKHGPAAGPGGPRGREAARGLRAHRPRGGLGAGAAPPARARAARRRVRRAGPLDIPNYRQRLAGFKKELGPAPPEARGGAGAGRPQPGGGRAEVARILRRQRRPLAVFAANYALTVGTLRRGPRGGRAVPDEVELVGLRRHPDGRPAALSRHHHRPGRELDRPRGRADPAARRDPERQRSAQHVLLAPRLIPR